MASYAELRALSVEVPSGGVGAYADACATRGVPCIIRCADDLGEALLGFNEKGAIWLRRPDDFTGIPPFKPKPGGAGL